MQVSQPTIVFIHGYCNAPSMWDSTIKALKNYHCITLDMNAVGEELLQENKEITTVNYAHKVNEKLKAQKIDSFHLVGHSMGGYISAAFASHYSDKLLSLTLVHSILGSEIEKLLPIKIKTIQLLEKGDLERRAFFKAMVRNLFDKEFARENNELLEQYNDLANSLSPELIIGQYKAIIERPNFTSISENIPFPIHWIIGSEDKVVPTHYSFDEITSVPKSYMSHFKSVAHMVMDEDLEGFLLSLESYLSFIQEYYRIEP